MDGAAAVTLTGHSKNLLFLSTASLTRGPPILGGDEFCHPQMWDLQDQASCHPMHDAVQTKISAPQHSPLHVLLSTTVTPLPLLKEVEVETQVSFQSLIHCPVREHPTTSCHKVKPPSYNLTSEDHFSFIKEKGGKEQGRRKLDTWTRKLVLDT